MPTDRVAKIREAKRRLDKDAQVVERNIRELLYPVTTPEQTEALRAYYDSLLDEDSNGG